MRELLIGAACLSPWVVLAWITNRVWLLYAGMILELSAGVVLLVWLHDQPL